MRLDPLLLLFDVWKIFIHENMEGRCVAIQESDEFRIIYFKYLSSKGQKW